MMNGKSFLCWSLSLSTEVKFKCCFHYLASTASCLPVWVTTSSSDPGDLMADNILSPLKSTSPTQIQLNVRVATWNYNGTVVLIIYPDVSSVLPPPIPVSPQNIPKFLFPWCGHHFLEAEDHESIKLHLTFVFYFSVLCNETSFFSQHLILRFTPNLLSIPVWFFSRSLAHFACI